MSLKSLVEFPKKSLLLMGVWPKSNSSLGYIFRGAFTMQILLAILLCLIYNSSYHLDNVIEFSESSFVLMTVINAANKVITMFLKRNKVLKLLDMIDIPSFTKYGKLYSSSLNDGIERVKKAQIYYWTSLILCILALFAIPVLGSKPLPLDFPHFNNGTFHYPFYLFQVGAITVVGHNNMGLDIFMSGLILIAAIQLKILNRKLVDTDKNVKNLHNYSEQNEEKLTVKYLHECCMHFSDIEEFVKCLQEAFSVALFVQLGASIFAICNSGLQLSKAGLPLAELITYTVYLQILFAQLGVYCWCGNVVYIESLEIGTSCYMSNWYEHGTAVRKTLFMLMERTKKPLEIKALKFVTLSHLTYITILRWTYSYFTLMKNSIVEAAN